MSWAEKLSVFVGSQGPRSPGRPRVLVPEGLSTRGPRVGKWGAGSQGPREQKMGSNMGSVLKNDFLKGFFEGIFP